jgi:transposase
LLCFVTALAGAVAEADAGAPLREVLAAALEANERLARLADELRAENARRREDLACRDAELERVNAELAVLQRLLFGRSSERVRPEREAGTGTTAGTGRAAVRTAGRAVQGPGRGGGITRICPGSR